MSKLLEHPEALSNIIRRIAIEAGDILLPYFDGLKTNEVTRKENGTPSTTADKMAEDFIIAELNKITPGVPVIAEEAFESGDITDIDQIGAQHFWLVDALDGTQAFLRDSEDFTVNIALIHNYVPILGIVFAPAHEVLYAGFGKNTAIKHNTATDKEKRIHVRPEPQNGVIVARSNFYGNTTRLDDFLGGFKVRKHIRKSSSLKICLIAEGKADLYPRFGPTSLWDTASGHAILSNAGGHITNLDGQNLKYIPNAENILNPDFVASGFQWWS